jgi:hypothetical protein
MGSRAGSDPVIVRPGEGRRSGGTSGTGRVKVDLADNRSFAIVESSPPAGALGPPRHIHDEYDEAWYVLTVRWSSASETGSNCADQARSPSHPAVLRTDSATQGHATPGCWSSLQPSVCS